MAARLAHAATGRVLVIWQQVEKARLCRLGPQILWQYAIVVAVDALNLRLHWCEGLQGAKVGRRLHEDAAARIDQHFGGKVQPLLRARGDENLCRFNLQPLSAKVLGNPFAQRAVTLAGGVLQGRCAVLRQDACCRLRHFIHRKGQG